MRSILPASKRALLRHLGVALVAALLATVWGGASAQTVAVLITIQPYGTTPGGATCGLTSPLPHPSNWICVDQEPVKTPDVDSETNVAILWTLDPTTATGAGWYFDPSNGIYMGSKRWATVAGPYAAPQQPPLPAQYIAFSLRENGMKKYRYKINLINTNSTTLKWDPTIMN